MTKADLCATLAEKTTMSKAEAERAVNAFLETISDELSKGESVTLTGFGTFKVNERKARTGRNPKTGESMQIPAGKAVKFTAGKSLKDTVK